MIPTPTGIFGSILSGQGISSTIVSGERRGQGWGRVGEGGSEIFNIKNLPGKRKQ